MSGPQPRDTLLARLLDLAEGQDAPALDDHPDDERLAQLALGQLPADQREPLVAHVADCDLCRRAVAQVLRVSAAAEQSVPQANAASPAQHGRWEFWRPRWPLAVAAGLLLVVAGVGLVQQFSGDREAAVYAQALAELKAGRFDATRQMVEEAMADGVRSPRLASLMAQAHRQMPSALALAHAGRLSDFGVEIGGIVSRDPAQWPHRRGLSEAESVLASAGQDVAVLLNRGHVYLSRGEVSKAGQQFAAAAFRAPRDPLVWLGQGIVAFLQDDLPAAESAFRRAAELAPDNTAAKINLAMTLQERGQRREAIEAWKRVLAQRDLAPQERAKIEREIKLLEASP
jgi:tetratricopeptide (TPR) repeat protein